MTAMLTSRIARIISLAMIAATIQISTQVHAQGLNETAQFEFNQPGYEGDGYHDGYGYGGRDGDQPRFGDRRFACQKAQADLNQAQVANNIATYNLTVLPQLCGNNMACVVAYQNVYNQSVVAVQQAQQRVRWACGRY